MLFCDTYTTNKTHQLGAKPLLMLKFIYPKPLQDKIVQDFQIFERKIRHLELINQNVL